MLGNEPRQEAALRICRAGGPKLSAEVKVEPVPTAGVHSVVNKVLAYTLSTMVVHHGRDVASKPDGTLNPAVPFSRQGQWSLEG